MKTVKRYHVGLTISRTGLARFQLRRDKDYLSCELYEYYGERITTKAGFLKRLRDNFEAVQAEILQTFPKARRLAITID